MAGGLWRVAREAGIVRRIVYLLAVAALAIGAAEVVWLVWRGASAAPGFRSISSPATTMGIGVYVDPHTTGEFRSLAIATVALLVALPWVARRRGAFGPGRQYLFLVFVGFIGSFGFIRLSARLMRSPRVPWWPGSVVSESGVHLHHLVWGITMMMAAGVISFALLASGWWYEVCAFVFGVGMGLTIDEFALWIYLDDVYWSREGHSSIDASVIAVAFTGLIVVGGFSINIDAPAPFNVLGTAFVVAVILARSVSARDAEATGYS